MPLNAEMGDRLAEWLNWNVDRILMQKLLIASLLAMTSSIALAQQTPAKLTFYKTADAAACSGDQSVWIDPQTQVYYVKGDKLYGKTKRGGYNCRRQADAAGYHPSRSH